MSHSSRFSIDTNDTIVAISTPPGEGGIGIVRMSGPLAIDIAQQLFAPASSAGSAFRRVQYGHVVNRDGDVIDEVLLHVMRAPHTYTREDVVEINGHGGMGPMSAILEACLNGGARLAAPGEFTLRAFLNGRIDLVQAEAVIDQIRARTETNLKAANAALGGALSRELFQLKENLSFALARLEAAVDFPEEDLGELVDPQLIETLRDTHSQMLRLLNTADAGRLLREGATVAIAGRPNVGKSSLFNALLRENRAIVTSQPGTTRDRLEEYISIGGVPVKLVDTAGLRETQDEVEQIGVERAREAIESAQIALLVLDASAPVSDEEQALQLQLEASRAPVVLVLNKSDLAPEAENPWNGGSFRAVCRISALTTEGLPQLEAAIERILWSDSSLSASSPMLTRVHQKDSLRRAVECVERLLGNLDISPEFLALELQQALAALGEITGETTPDDILEHIFSSFCIGK